MNRAPCTNSPKPTIAARHQPANVSAAPQKQDTGPTAWHPAAAGRNSTTRNRANSRIRSDEPHFNPQQCRIGGAVFQNNPLPKDNEPKALRSKTPNATIAAKIQATSLPAATAAADLQPHRHWLQTADALLKVRQQPDGCLPPPRKAGCQNPALLRNRKGTLCESREGKTKNSSRFLQRRQRPDRFCLILCHAK